MKVEFQHTRLSVGLLSKAPGILLRVEFSPEELAVIKAKELSEHVVFEEYPSKHIPERMRGRTTIGGLVEAQRKGRQHHLYFDTVADAELFDAHIREALKKLKHFIDGFAFTGPMSDSYEL